MKLCKTCKREKDATEFSKEKRLKDGLKSSCNSCINFKRREAVKNAVVPKEKTCCTCKKLFRIANFHKSSHSSDLHTKRCKGCCSASCKKFRDVLISKNKELSKNLNYKKVCCNCKQEKWAKEFNTKYDSLDNLDSRCKGCAGVIRRKSKLKVRNKVFDHYGRVCNNCGMEDFDLLVIDHINNNGAEHRREIGGCAYTYRWLITNNFPEGFQTLCANCNIKKTRNNGKLNPNNCQFFNMEEHK